MSMFPITAANKIIVNTITSYLNVLEDDIVFQTPILERFFAEMTQRPSEMYGCHTYLDWTQRDSTTRYCIDSAFHAIRENWGSSAWNLFKGSSYYNMCHINEYSLMKILIQQAPLRKDFYAIDPGAGDFSSSDGLADFINTQTDLRSDFTLHIIGMIAESSLAPKIVKSGKCTIYNLSQFKTEEMATALQRCEVPVKEGEVDMIRTRWSLRHFVDPVGTFVSLFNYLRPGTGVFLGDGFFFLEKHDRSWSHYVYSNPNLNMINLLLNSGAPFLMEHNDGFRGLNDFIIKRADDTRLQLNMRYESCGGTDPEADVGSKCVMRFSNAHPHRDYSDINFPMPKWSTNADDLHGSRSLHAWLSMNGLVDPEKQPWKPILEVEREKIEAAQVASKKIFPASKAVQKTKSETPLLKEESSSESRLERPKEKGNITAIAQWLKMGDCVILHNRKEGFYFHQGLSHSLDQIRVICVEVNPDTGLLCEDEWPGFLTASGFKFATPEFLKQVEDLDKVPHLYHFRFGY